MLFNSFAFLYFFLPIVLGIAFCLRGPSLIRWISCSSFVFYACAGHWWFLIPMAITTCIDFYLAPRIENATRPSVKQLLLLISLAGNLGLLFYFKYAKLFYVTALKLHAIGLSSNWERLFETVLPAGISFYTFQTLSYIIDVYRGNAHAERSFWKFACFVSFFPHLIAGPLTRHHQLIPALDRIEREGIIPRWPEGIFLFVLGLSKKVLIADRIANFIDPWLIHPADLNMLTAWLCIIGYSLQIYFDFSGYSDMAIGLGRLFGVELPQNFNSPYKATSPSDFWKRWHITLSLWLRDYLYIPLGGNRCSNARRNVNLMVTMVLGGLWHGASWAFAVWGAYHGLLLVGYHAMQFHWDRMHRWIQRGITYFLICIGWVFFRGKSLDVIHDWLRAAFVPSKIPGPLGPDVMALTIFLGLGLVIVQGFPTASGYRGYRALTAWPQCYLGILAILATLFMNYSSRFLYYQF